MAGHLGQETVTTLNVTVWRVDVERGLILVKGAVPGTEGTLVKIRDAVKSAAAGRRAEAGRLPQGRRAAPSSPPKTPAEEAAAGRAEAPGRTEAPAERRSWG